MELNKKAYTELIKQDLEWLENQPRTLERDHIIKIVAHSIKTNYEEMPSLRTQNKALRVSIDHLKGVMIDDAKRLKAESTRFTILESFYKAISSAFKE